MVQAGTGGSFARAKDLLDLQANGWSADGRQLLFAEVTPNHQCAIGQIAIERPSDANVLLQGASCNWLAAVSPNGAWMAYDWACQVEAKSISNGIRSSEIGTDLDGRRHYPTLVA